MPVGKTYWIEKGMFSKKLQNQDCDKDGIADHISFWVKSSFVHAVHPLGFIRKIKVKINDKDIALNDIFVVIRKNWIPASCVPTISDIWWNMGEKAYIYIRCPGGLKEGTYHVKLSMEFSTLFNTRTVDYNDLTHHMTMELEENMTIQGG